MDEGPRGVYGFSRGGEAWGTVSRTYRGAKHADRLESSLLGHGGSRSGAPSASAASLPGEVSPRVARGGTEWHALTARKPRGTQPRRRQRTARGLRRRPARLRTQRRSELDQCGDV